MKSLLLILDNCNVAIAAEPSGGVTIRLNGIEGLPNTTLLIPIAREAAVELHTGMGNFLQKTKVYGLDDLQKETK